MNGIRYTGARGTSANTHPAAKAIPAPAVAAPTPTLASAAPTPSLATPAPAAARLKLGSTLAHTDIGFLLVNEQVFFAEQRIDMEFVNFPRTDDMIAPMGTGELDVGALLGQPGRP